MAEQLALSLPRKDAERLLGVLSREVGDWPSAQALRAACEADRRRAFVELDGWLVRAVARDVRTAAERLEVAIEFYSVARHVDMARDTCKRVRSVDWAMGLVSPAERDAFKSRCSYMSTYSSAKLATFMADNDGSIDVERAYVAERAKCDSCEKSYRMDLPLADFVADVLTSKTLDMLRLEASKEATLLDGRRRLDVCAAYRRGGAPA
jgi:hypothetical protein